MRKLRFICPGYGQYLGRVSNQLHTTPTQFPVLSERLQAVTEALAAARTQEEVVQIVLPPALNALNALAGAVLLVDETGTRLEIAATQGYEQGSPLLWQDGLLNDSVPAGYALERREPLFFEQQGALVQAYPELEARTDDVAATAVLPMFLDHRPLGTLILDFQEPHQFSVEEQRFLQTLAAQCAIALGRAQLTTDLQRQVNERTQQLLADTRAQEGFMAFTQAAGLQTDVKALAQQAIEVLRTRFPDSKVSYYEYDATTARWQAQVWSEDHSSAQVTMMRAGFPSDTPIFADVLQTRQPVFRDAWDAGREQIEHTEEFGQGATYPLLVNGETQGILAMAARHQTRWVARDRALVQAVGHGLTLALERTGQARRLASQNAELEARTLALERFAQLARSPETDATLLIRQAQQAVNELIGEGFAVYYEPDGQKWHLRSQVGSPNDATIQKSLESPLTYATALNLLIPWERGEPFYQDAYDPALDHGIPGTERLASTATLPVWVDTRRQGIFGYGLEVSRPWTRADRATLETAVNSLGLLLERAERTRELEARTREVSAWRERYEVAVRDSGHLLYDWNPATDVILYGGAVEQITGYAVQELAGNLSDWTQRLIHPDDREPFAQELTRVIASGGEAHVKFRLLHKDGSVREVEDDGYFKRDAQGEVTQMVGFVKDVTERNQAEQALKRLNEELQRSNAELEQFAYIASHDLQAPIRTVTSFAGIIDKRYGETLDERGRLYLRQIIDGGEHMKRLVDDLLAFSRIHTEQRPLQPTNAKAIFDTVASRLQGELPNAAITRGELPMVLADGQQLDQLLQNLIANGLKYCRAEVRPEVRVSAERDGIWWRFAVQDNGIGIEPEYFERIFEIFQRLHGRENYEGTGIGLAVCKKIVERHGGRLWLESTPGQGSTFHFTLPEG